MDSINLILRKKIYEEGYERYMPWDHTGYRGIMVVEEDQTQYRFERTFSKSKDKLFVFNHVSGEDLTDQYDYNKVTKLVDVAKKHIGFNKVAYKNTISLTQMQSRTEEEMVREIKDNMSNLASTHESTISVELVLETIKKESDAIGSMRKRTSVYYKLAREIESLNNELEEAKAVAGTIVLEKERENGLLKELAMTQEKEEDIRKQISFLTYLDNLNMIEKSETIVEAINKAKQDLEGLALYEHFNMKVVGQLQLDKETMLKLESEMKSLSETIKLKEENLEALTRQKESGIDLQSTQNAYDLVNRVVIAYENDDEQLKIRKQEKQMIAQQRVMLGDAIRPKRSLVILLMLAVVALASVVGGLVYSPIMYGFTLIVLIGIMVTFYYDKQRLINHNNQVLKIDKLEQQMAMVDKNIDILEARIEDTLEEHGCMTIYDLNVKRDDYLKKVTIAKEKEEEIKRINQNILILNQEITGLRRTIGSIGERKQLLEEDHIRQLQHYQIVSDDHIQGGAFEKHLTYQAAIKDIENMTLRLKELIGNTSVDGLKRQVNEMKASLEADNELTQDKIDQVKLQMSQNNLHESLGQYLEIARLKELAITEDLSKVMQKGIELTKSIRPVAEIEEAIESAMSLKAAYERKLKVSDIMKETIETIAVEIQNNFAPALNESLSYVVDKVSGGKYKDIKVNPQMELTVFDQSQNRTVMAGSLSEGTIDMLYFGLRLGIGQVLSEGKALPLILDDAFVQYDNERLHNALEYLHKEERQVILFTCHEREEHYLDLQGYDYNLVELS